MLVVAPAILSESLPPQSRGRFMVLLDFFWPFGFLLAIGFWWAFIVNGVTVAGLAPWRVLFLAAAVPPLLAAVAPLPTPQSPLYHAPPARPAEAAPALGPLSGQPLDPRSPATGTT